MEKSRLTVAELVALVRVTCRVIARDWPQCHGDDGCDWKDVPDLDTVLQGVLDELEREGHAPLT